MTITTYTVAETNPIQVFPAGLQKSATIMNTGAQDVYVSDTNAGQIAHAYKIAPEGTLQWNDATPLYAFMATAGLSTKILVNTAMIQLANPQVNATIDGTVNVDGNVTAVIPGTVTTTMPGGVVVSGEVTATMGAPVTITGGGQLLVDTAFSLDIGGISNINIPLPASGAIPPSIRIEVVADAGTAGDVRWSAFDYGGWVTRRGNDMNADFGANNINVTVPCNRALPHTLTLRAPSSNGAGISGRVRVWALQSAPPVPVTNPFISRQTLTRIMLTNIDVPKWVALPPAFTPYRVRVRPAANSVWNVELHDLMGFGSSPSLTLLGGYMHVPDNYYLGNDLLASNTGKVTTFVAGGTGNAQALMVVGGGAGAAAEISIHPIV